MHYPGGPLVDFAIAHSDHLQDFTEGFPFVFIHLDNCCRPMLQVLDPRGEWYLTIDWVGNVPEFPDGTRGRCRVVNTPATHCFHHR